MFGGCANVDVTVISARIRQSRGKRAVWMLHLRDWALATRALAKQDFEAFVIEKAERFPPSPLDDQVIRGASVLPGELEDVLDASRKPTAVTLQPRTTESDEPREKYCEATNAPTKSARIARDKDPSRQWVNCTDLDAEE